MQPMMETAKPNNGMTNPSAQGESMAPSELNNLLLDRSKLQGSSNAWDIVVLVCAGILAIGIIGEVISSVRSVMLHFRLQNNEKSIEFARGRIEDEKDRQANAQSEQFQHDIAISNERAAEAESKTAALYEKMRWRHIKPEKKDGLLLAFRNLKDEEMRVYKIYFSVMDPEAESLAFEIAGVEVQADPDRNLVNRQFNPPFFSPSHMQQLPGGPEGPVMPIGVCLFAIQGSRSWTSLSNLVRALNESGISCFTQDWPELKDGEIRIEVGYNPATATEIQITQENQPTSRPQ